MRGLLQIVVDGWPVLGIMIGGVLTLVWIGFIGWLLFAVV
jgi:hypothetical protein